MVCPVAELTQTAEGEVVFSDIRPSYSPTSRTSVDEIAQYQPGSRTDIFACEADESDQYGRRGESAEAYYTRLWRYHQRWDDDRYGRREFKDKIAVTRALGSSLPVSTYERREAVVFVRSHNGRRFNQYGGILAMALGAFAAIRDEVISARSQQLSDQLENPLERRLSTYDCFIDVCEQHDVDWYSAYTKVKAIRNRE
ncbi:hypothetical protein [Natrialba swarupiae]|uniref:Uncharacterized protein n=1 Tax=Natrialba swarupiae TaxID=2448032 RepID=A0A5D5APT6_9EURY|nr:hypothetical protein [Natrialba swarupiae]TYT61772.1 hypothetical protein FYC77_12165 [Natrialba swarupiae]